jgi:hypothetical protein
MKKNLLLFVIALFVVSCNDSIPEPLSTKQSINITVNKSNWIESTDGNGLNRYYSCHFSMPEITYTIFKTGSVTAYYYNGDAQQLLPYVRHYQNTLGEYWTQTVDFDYTQGGIDIYVTTSDFAAIKPDAMDFRVVLMW